MDAVCVACPGPPRVSQASSACIMLGKRTASGKTKGRKRSRRAKDAAEKQTVAGNSLLALTHARVSTTVDDHDEKGHQRCGKRRRAREPPDSMLLLAVVCALYRWCEGMDV